MNAKPTVRVRLSKSAPQNASKASKPSTDLSFVQKMAKTASPNKVCASTALNQGMAFGRPSDNSTNPDHLACGAKFCPTGAFLGVDEHDRRINNKYYLVASRNEFYAYTSL
jgi:hypothetical protein